MSPPDVPVKREVDSLSLKWGTLKSWEIHSETGRALLKRYHEIGSSLGAMTQRDTPEQKEIICQLIDGCSGEIYLDWDGKYVSKEKAKEYVRDYGKQADYDPTPWCSGCGAMKRKDCHCGPIAENE